MTNIHNFRSKKASTIAVVTDSSQSIGYNLKNVGRNKTDISGPERGYICR